MSQTLPITVLIAARNEEANLGRCLDALAPAGRTIVIDSQSTDRTASIAQSRGAEVIQFTYGGGYPKKRQWALDTLQLATPWVLLIDADEVVPTALWQEIAGAIGSAHPHDAYLITKGFHFLGRKFSHGGFSHSAVLLFRTGAARFERLIEDAANGLDMEVHERLIVSGNIGTLRTPLIHEDFKGLEAYIARHNRYSTWEAQVRAHFHATGSYGDTTIVPRLFGNVQERRRALKSWIIRLPFEPTLWFLYHYVARLGFLEGRPGFIACRIRSAYISQVHAKLHEIRSRAR